LVSGSLDGTEKNTGEAIEEVNSISVWIGMDETREV
jgi:hypothetical protein